MARATDLIGIVVAHAHGASQALTHQRLACPFLILPQSREVGLPFAELEGEAGRARRPPSDDVQRNGVLKGGLFPIVRGIEAFGNAWVHGLKTRIFCQPATTC